MTDEQKELKECPFCGGEAELTTRGNGYTKKRSAEIKCKDCNVKIICGAIKLGMYFCINTVTKHWNSRKGVDNG